MFLPSFLKNPHVAHKTTDMSQTLQYYAYKTTKRSPPLTKPKGMVLNWNKPLGVLKAVYGLDLILRLNANIPYTDPFVNRTYALTFY